MRIPLAREGLPFILSTTGAAVVLLLAAAYAGGTILWVAALCLAVVAAGVLAFFRDPERHGPRGADLVLAPADGKVIDIGLVEEASFMKSESLCVSIFMSLFDVHVNRYPVTGDVEHRTYDAGRFEPAWRRSASHSNERASTGIRSSGRSVLVRQIAGLAAKRIVTYAELGERVEQGERMGLIRFGSRVEVFLPKGSIPKVSVGQRAVGGMTVLAQMSAASEGAE
jgi:phosphatidylserine decarboxylase